MHALHGDGEVDLYRAHLHTELGRNKAESGAERLRALNPDVAVEVLELLPEVPKEMVAAVHGVEAPATLADLVAGYLDIKPEEKQQLLEEVDLRRRLDQLMPWCRTASR